jgi:hypothetical protein
LRFSTLQASSSLRTASAPTAAPPASTVESDDRQTTASARPAKRRRLPSNRVFSEWDAKVLRLSLAAEDTASFGIDGAAVCQWPILAAAVTVRACADNDEFLADLRSGASLVDGFPHGWPASISCVEQTVAELKAGAAGCAGHVEPLSVVRDSSAPLLRR